jgi:hypothetical protein
MPRQHSKPPDTLPYPTETDAEAIFRVGQRIRMSPLGAARCPRLARKTGTIFGFTNYKNSVSVVFEGNKSSTSIHVGYIKPFDD